jgi:hypothetical protein
MPVAVAVAELCRRAMGPPRERPGYRVTIQECPTCKTASRDVVGGAITLKPEEIAAAKVDAEILDLSKGGTGTFTHTIRPAERRAVIGRDHERCRLCGTRDWMHLHHLERKDRDVDVLMLLCWACHKRLVHGGYVRIEGRGEGARFLLVDGTEARVRGTG